MTRRVAVLLVLLAALGGCSAIATSGELGRAGYSNVEVSTSSTNGLSTVSVTAGRPPGRSAPEAVADAERVIWRTHPGPIDRLVVAVDGLSEQTDAAQLTARFGPRDPALSGPGRDPADEVRAAFTTVAWALAGVGVLLGVAAVVIVVVAGRRTAGTPPPDPTAAVGARIARYVVDHAVWSSPVLIVFAAVVAAIANGLPGAGFLVPVWFLGALLWGWGSYAWWAARHDGRTIGMRRLGLRVVDAATGGPVPLGRHTVRWLMIALDGAFFGLVGLLTLILGPLHQRVGDLAARTVVIREPVTRER